MNKNLRIVILITLAALALSACGPAAVTSSSPEQPHTLSVNGTGSVTLAPDMANISVGVSSEGSSAERALAENNRQAEAIHSTLAELGIAPEDIQTSNFSVYPRQEYDNGKVVRTYYVVSNTVSVTVRELEDLGAVLDAVVGSGANQVSGISFDIADRESANQQALEAAMLNAQGRAEALAGVAEVQITGVFSVNSYIGGGGVEVVYETRALAADVAGASVPVAPGEMTVHVDVSVVYTIEDK